MRTVVVPLPDDSIGDQRDAIAVLAAGNTLIAGCLVGVLGLQASLLFPAVTDRVPQCFRFLSLSHDARCSYLSSLYRAYPFLARFPVAPFAYSVQMNYGRRLIIILPIPFLIIGRAGVRATIRNTGAKEYGENGGCSSFGEEKAVIGSCTEGIYVYRYLLEWNDGVLLFFNTYVTVGTGCRVLIHSPELVFCNTQPYLLRRHFQ
jgi:hypothetical protein